MTTANLSLNQLPDLIRLGMRRDSWEPDYQSAMHLDRSDRSKENVAVNLELPAQDWRPLFPELLQQHSMLTARQEALKALGDLVFLDGILRMHQRFIFEHQQRYEYAGLGTAIVGAMRLRPGQPLSIKDALFAPQVRRCLLINQDFALAEASQIPGIPYAFESYGFKRTDDQDAEASQLPDSALLAAMRASEKDYLNAIMSQCEAQHLAVTLIVDGPLQKQSTRSNLPVVGFVKTLHTQYLPPEQQAILPRLQAGQRSPLFQIGDKQVSWYLRLSPLDSLDHALSGIVRLEVISHRIQAEIPRVQALADHLALVLPQLTLGRHEDPRSPQNLLPIHTLEKQLKMRLGNRQLLSRAIDAYFKAQESRL